jgi:hypothetical protein
VIVQALDNTAPSAAFSATPGSAPAGTAIAFDASASRDADGSIRHFRWDFDGDGAYETDTGSQPRVARAFAAPGSVRVGLLVEDDRGSSAMATPVTLTITPATARPDAIPPDLSSLGASPTRVRPGQSTRVRVIVGEAARLELTLRRTGRRAPVRRITRRVRGGETTLGVSARGLVRGRYRLEIVAIDTAGNRSLTLHPGFRVV